jgi:hypothetical protein
MSKLRSYTRACIFLALLAATAFSLSAQTFQTLHRFKYTDGEYPWGPLVQASDGNLYGTVSTGGDPSCAPGGYSTGCGTLFQITPGGKLTTIWLRSLCGVGPNHQRGLLRCNARRRHWQWRRGLRSGLRYDLHHHRKWYADDPLQLQLHGWRRTHRDADPRSRW